MSRSGLGGPTPLHTLLDHLPHGEAVFAELSFLQVLAGRQLEIVLVSRRRRGRIQGLLGAWGCRCIHERESGPALERLRLRHADAVLVALTAPERDTLARSIADLDRPRRGPWPRLIALVAGRRDAEAARRAGYHEVLVEPVSETELQGVLLGLAADVGEVER